MESLGKLLVVVGLLTAGLGALLWSGAGSWLRLGRLPGDIAIRRDGLAFYFPITTMILLSLLLSGGLWIVSRFRR